ncbi:chemotaxis protein CheX [Desulfobaculum xiamenense]|uniref:Chemotaxis protein CheX n=1 Tax=Desulfobaculum xiamenense TaxID=995050 RepID=A0A846QUW3_9BACT|nr:chemotaxis protein CheX [Desulfobaculum xiamenense]NJB69335.1 chemotaxis protein CheX [Desulfobaculum xiamenense]
MQRIDVNIVNPFLASVIDVLGTMAKVQARPGKPFIKKDSTANGDVTGLIPLTGERPGTVAVTFARRAALEIAGRMLGETFDEISEDVRDAVGEITNMISGQARQGLAAQGSSYRAGIPTVLSGPGHPITHCADGPILGLSFATMFGDVTVEVCFGETTTDARLRA